VADDTNDPKQRALKRLHDEARAKNGRVRKMQQTPAMKARTTMKGAGKAVRSVGRKAGDKYSRRNWRNETAMSTGFKKAQPTARGAGYRAADSIRSVGRGVAKGSTGTGGGSG